MPWFKVDDKLHSHPKWLATKPGARALWVTAGAWSADQLTDGCVPRHVLPTLGGRKVDADNLVAVGLWDRTPDGWRFHQWDERQPSRAHVQTERATAKQRQADARARARARASRAGVTPLSQRDTPVTPP